MKITRRTKLGFAYETAVMQSKGMGLPEIESPEQPEKIGTVRQLRDAIRNDRTFQAVATGGTYFKQCWFVKSDDGVWVKISPDQEVHPLDLLDKLYHPSKKYFVDSLDVETEV